MLSVRKVLLTFLSDNETDVEMPVPTLNPNSIVSGSSRGSCKKTYKRQLRATFSLREFMNQDNKINMAA